MTTASSCDRGRLPENLPAPSVEETAISRALTQRIREEIAATGVIDFARFMELALYAPGLGYYSAGQQKFAAAGDVHDSRDGGGRVASGTATGGSTSLGPRGDPHGCGEVELRREQLPGSALGPHETSVGAAGDFITAPEMGSLFARCLARQCAQILVELGTGDILEVGAGSGALVAELLLELERLGKPPANYFILELSADLRERQEYTLKQRAPQWFERVRWLDTLPAHGFRGVVIGNELLDAMPVTRFRIGDEGIEELCVDWAEDGFAWRPRPASAVVRDRVGKLALPSDYISEINFRAEAWIKSVAERLEQGVILLVDYGFPRTEFYHPQRVHGTLMCHYRHRAHDDPLILVGLQDITAHVDFTAVAEAGTEAGLKLLGYTSQAAFLLGCGLEQVAAKSDPEDIRLHLELTQQIKKLTLPSEMGELYKVIALGRGVETPLMGFTVQDRRGRL